MKLTAIVPGVAVVLAVTSNPCFAAWDLEVVTKERAAELNARVRSTPAGPGHVNVELEFAIDDDLEHFRQVDLRLTHGEHLVLSTQLREDRSKPGFVTVRLTADTAKRDELSLRILVPFQDGGAGGTIHEFRLKDFVEPK